MENLLIEKLLKENEMTQNDLSKMLGVSEAAISQWNDQNISVDNIYKMSRIFNIPVDVFYSEDKDDYEYYKMRYTDAFDDVLYNNHGVVDSWSYDMLLKHLKHASYRFYELLIKVVQGTYNEEDDQEMSLLKQYFVYSGDGESPYEIDLEDDLLSYEPQELDEIELDDDLLPNGSSKLVDIHDWDKWALQKNYKFQYTDELIDLNNYRDSSWTELERIEKYVQIVKILDPFRFDKIATTAYKEQKWDVLKVCLDNGANIMYTYDDFAKMESLNNSSTSYKIEDEKSTAYYYFKDIMGERESYLSGLLYDEYQECINHEAMEWFKVRCKYKDSNPMKYIEYMEKNYM